MVGSVLIGVLLAGCGEGRATEAGSAQSPRVASATVAPSSTAAAGPVDAPPHHADNNAWKYRKGAAGADQQRAATAATRITPVVTRLRAATSYDEDDVRKALQQLGFRADQIETTPFGRMTSQQSPPPVGTAYGVRTGGRACVLGEVSPRRATAEATSVNGEGLCIETFSH